MKSILMSIKPKWCELIASGKKTIEVRKTRPKLEERFKVYVYCTCSKITTKERSKNYFTDFAGKVIGEFVCDSILTWRDDECCPCNISETGLKLSEIRKYVPDDRDIFLWHISDLKIYDEPKILSEFTRCSDKDLRPCQNQNYCEYIKFDYSENTECCSIDFDGEHCPYLTLQRPPQSWCYVEDLGA